MLMHIKWALQNNKTISFIFIRILFPVFLYLLFTFVCNIYENVQPNGKNGSKSHFHKLLAKLNTEYNRKEIEENTEKRKLNGVK